MENKIMQELNDDELETVNGGFSVGDVVHIQMDRIEYCRNCGTLITNSKATITGVRGVLDGHTIYWITRSCCGHKTSEIETAFV